MGELCEPVRTHTLLSRLHGQRRHARRMLAYTPPPHAATSLAGTSTPRETRQVTASQRKGLFPRLDAPCVFSAGNRTAAMRTMVGEKGGGERTPGTGSW